MAAKRAKSIPTHYLSPMCPARIADFVTAAKRLWDVLFSSESLEAYGAVSLSVVTKKFQLLFKLGQNTSHVLVVFDCLFHHVVHKPSVPIIIGNAHCFC